jgi:hypothetical protein
LQTVGIVETDTAAKGEAIVVHNRELGTLAERSRDACQLSITVAEHPSHDFAGHIPSITATTLPAETMGRIEQIAPSGRASVEDAM